MDFILIVKFLYFSLLLLINYTFENFIYSLYYIIFKNPSSLKKSPSAKAKGLVIIWLFEWLSQSVLLIESIAIAKGYIFILVTFTIIPESVGSIQRTNSVVIPSRLNAFSYGVPLYSQGNVPPNLST